jgi:hypothetical protein
MTIGGDEAPEEQADKQCLLGVPFLMVDVG